MLLIVGLLGVAIGGGLGLLAGRALRPKHPCLCSDGLCTCEHCLWAAERLDELSLQAIGMEAHYIHAKEELYKAQDRVATLDMERDRLEDRCFEYQQQLMVLGAAE